MEFLLAGFIGALAATILAVMNSFFSRQAERRSSLAIEVISWIDDIYDRLITVHAQREATFTGAKFGLTNDEYRVVVKEVKAMLLASKMHAKVALVYGDSQELRKFDTLREEFMNVAETLLQAEKETWIDSDKQVNYRLSKIIDPLRESTERVFVLGSRSESIARDAVKRNLPTFYLTSQTKELVVRNDQGGSMGSVGRFVGDQSVKLFETFLAVLRVALIAGVLAWIVWHYTGRPDLYKAVQGLITNSVQVRPEPRFGLYIISPGEYGLSDEGEIAPVPDGRALIADKNEKPIKMGIENGEGSALVNGVFMLFLPQGVTVVNEGTWKDSWKELDTRNGKWFCISLKDDIKPGETADIVPPIEVKVPRDGEYRIEYKFFCDNFTPKTGFFMLAAHGGKSRR
ncbi:MAG: hypothetical protein WC779_00780 [Candidatus Omnitrophota bacterium]|jgi:hypothetical protein